MGITMTCPRCNAEFECNAHDIANCKCVHVQVQPKTREFLAKTEYGCLCCDCLVQLNDLVIRASQSPFPVDNESLIEGLHFYMDDGLMVFTEFYHIQRGYCCEKGCRHCAYGRKKTDTAQR
jgi:hypothetical protein